MRAGFDRPCAELGEEPVFTGDPARQLGEMHLHTGGGVLAVTDLKSARAALAEIVEQGEGAARTQVWDGDRDVFHPERDEVAHYYRFQELKHGRRYQAGDTPQTGPTGEPIRVDFGAVRPNPRIADHPEGSEIRVAQEAFNTTYCLLLYLLETAFTGDPGGMRAAVGAMFRLRGRRRR